MQQLSDYSNLKTMAIGIAIAISPIIGGGITQDMSVENNLELETGDNFLLETGFYFLTE